MLILKFKQISKCLHYYEHFDFNHKIEFFSPLVVLILFPKPVIELKGPTFCVSKWGVFQKPKFTGFSRVSFEHLGHCGIEDTMEKLQLQLSVLFCTPFVGTSWY